MKNMVTDSSKRTSSSYYGASGTIIGHLHWDPLVYSNKDGSKRYLFRVDTVSCRGNSNNTQAQNFAHMKAYVPADDFEDSPFAKLQQGSMVTVEYVVRTDTYCTTSGEQKSETYLSVQKLYLHGNVKVPSQSSSMHRRPAHPSNRHSHDSRGIKGLKQKIPSLRPGGCKFEDYKKENKKDESK